MDYYAFFLDKDEQKIADKKGIAYALKNRSKWVNIADVHDEVNTYDRGTTVFYYNGKAYNIHKDYVNVTEKYRVYIACDLNLSSDDAENIETKFFTEPQKPEAHVHEWQDTYEYTNVGHFKRCKCNAKTETQAHTFTEKILEPSTCFVQGKKQSTCTVCGFKKISYIPKSNSHEKSDKKVCKREATCMEDGVNSIVCKYCGEELDVERIPALGHEFGESFVSKQPTCTENGIRKKTCNRCGLRVTVENIPMLSHEPDEGTHTVIDGVEYVIYNCKHCGTELKRIELELQNLINMIELKISEAEEMLEKRTEDGTNLYYSDFTIGKLNDAITIANNAIQSSPIIKEDAEKAYTNLVNRIEYAEIRVMNVYETRIDLDRRVVQKINDAYNMGEDISSTDTTYTIIPFASKRNPHIPSDKWLITTENFTFKPIQGDGETKIYDLLYNNLNSHVKNFAVYKSDSIPIVSIDTIDSIDPAIRQLCTKLKVGDQFSIKFKNIANETSVTYRFLNVDGTIGGISCDETATGQNDNDFD